MHGSAPPSAWLLRWAHLLQPGSTLLDVACGSGRHVRWLAERGVRVTALDRDEQAVQSLRDLAEVIVADIEGEPWPFPHRQFDAVLITNYLWRPLWPTLLNSVAPGGLYIHETFAAGNQSVGRPSRADFLLLPGELLRTCADWRVIAYEDGFAQAPERYLQRIVAARPMAPVPASPAQRWPLAGQPPGAS